jgi:hypothetical protein
MNKLLFFIFIISIIAIPGKATAQEADDGGGGVLRLETIKVKAKVEIPRVTITKTRRKPKFNYVELEKDYRIELLSILKAFTYQSITSGWVKEIEDYKALVNKPRRLE